MTHVTCRLTAKNWDQLRNPTLGGRLWAIFTFLLRPKAAHNTSQLQRQKKYYKLKTKIHKKLETIRQITERMKSWYMHQFTTVFSNDFQICSLISKSAVNGSWLYDTIRNAILTCVRKPTWVSLIYRTETTTKNNCRPKTEKVKSKNGYAQK